MQQKDQKRKAPAESREKAGIPGSSQPSSSDASRPAALPVDPFFFLKQNAVSVKEAETASELLALNCETREHGLTLTAEQAPGRLPTTADLSSEAVPCPCWRAPLPPRLM